MTFSVFGLHHTHQAVDAQHPSGQAGAAIKRGYLGWYLPCRLPGGSFLLDDGPLAGQLSPGTDTLLPWRR